MLPALMERDLEAFGNALYDFNRRVGNLFKPWQGDVYGHPIVGEIIRDCAPRELKVSAKARGDQQFLRL